MSSPVSFIEQGFRVEHWGPVLTPLSSIADAARTCYRSGDKEKWAEQPGSKVHDDRELVERLIARDHGAMLEHSYLSVRFWTDRAVANEIVVSGNFREWRHFLKLRTAPDAHPQMRALTLPLLERLQPMIPVVFDDIQPEVSNG